VMKCDEDRTALAEFALRALSTLEQPLAARKAG